MKNVQKCIPYLSGKFSKLWKELGAIALLNATLKS
jgi:hypothetical protein